ncbi:SDR family oxidoreductase [Deinococcus ruber]|uniref:Short chain dehydrogenase n=1 Tax=Deinococcus ruber TaxID=1848197 RepID=A0A918C9T2_9DEIO|nr:SDR family oxidoreductase [Deinococcus ruber]GGR12992.1 short chain dehydrogenase [Deinococcus ruber]
MSHTGMKLAGQRVVVIGGASGIGFAVAELAHAQGATVIIASSSETRVRTAATRLDGAAAHTVDLRDESSVARLFEDVGEYHHLAITAGDWSSAMFGSVRDLDLDQARGLLDVRFWGVLAAVKHGCRSIVQNGSITLTSGMLAQRPRPGTPLATAMGGAVEHLTYGLAMDLAPIRVNAVSPGLVLTEHVRQRPERAVQAMVASLPIPRGALPEEAAEAYVYLMLSAYATGQVLPVDGGGLLV